MCRAGRHDDSNDLTWRASLAAQALIMDEVDGMGSGDHGGLGELAKLVKDTKVGKLLSVQPVAPTTSVTVVGAHHA